MQLPRIIPCLLLENRRLIKTVKFKAPVYIGDPINAVRIFNEKLVDEILILDKSKTKNRKSPDFDFLNNLANECFIPAGYGGGIRTLADIEKIFTIGFEKVILNSIVYSKPEVVIEAVKIFGSQSIVISIDVKKNFFNKYFLFSNCGTRRESITLVDYINLITKLQIGEVFLNSIDRDGSMRGYDIELIKKLSSKLTVPLIACGGAGKLTDFNHAITYGHASAAAAGSFFIFQGKHKGVLISYPKYSDIKQLFSDTNKGFK